MVPCWPESVILHTPARREDHKVSNRHTWFGAWASQDSIDGGVLSGGWEGRGFIGAAIDGGVLSGGTGGEGVHWAAIDGGVLIGGNGRGGGSLGQP